MTDQHPNPATSYAMRAVRRGGPEVLERRDVPLPEPGPEEVRIRTERAGVLTGDVFWQRGLIPGAPKPPFVPGYDVVGTVETVGREVRDIAPGNRVAALIEFGGYATHALASVDRVARMPDGLDWDAACALATPYVTAYQILVQVADAQPSQRILVHGAAGATGQAVLDLARHIGLRAWGTASSPKHDVVRAYGATPIDYRAERFEDVVRRAGGMDIVIDPIGGRHFARSWSVLAPGGRLVAIAAMAALAGAGTFETVRSFAGLALRNALPNGRAAGMHNVVAYVKKHGMFAKDFEALARLSLDGAIEPSVQETYPLTDAASAQRRLLDGEARGRVALVT